MTTTKMLIITSIVLFFVLSYVAAHSLDPDFGWHYRMGELIVHNGIPQTDPFSYTMPSYQYADHEWLSNILLFHGYNTIGFFGLALIFAALAVLALLVQQFPGKKDSVFTMFLFSLAGFSLLPLFGIRLQIVTWVFTALLYKVVWTDVLWKKFRFGIPLGFLLWSNLHGGFVFGLGILVFGFCLKAFLTKKRDIGDFLIVLTSICVTLFNPYGVRLWHEIWMSLSDASLRFAIVEWYPAFFFFIPFLSFFTVFSLSFVWFYRKKLPKDKVILYIVLFILGLSSIRNMPLWILFAYPLTVEAEWHFVQHARLVSDGTKRLAVAKRIFLIGFTVLAIPIILFDFFSFQNSNEVTTYPKAAIAYLATHPASGRIYSEYTWGGYIIWKLPGQKVFIDGRMPSWRNSNPPLGESANAFQELIKLKKGEIPISAEIAKYQIDTFLLPVQQLPQETLSTQLLNILGIHQKPKKSLSQQLIDENWKVVYQDDVARVYKQRGPAE